VRECDAASIGKGRGEVVWDVLEAILRTTVDDTNPVTLSYSEPSRSGIFLHAPWVAGPPSGLKIWGKVENETLFDATERNRILSVFKPLHVTPGPQRRPPNLHPAIIYYGPPGSIPLSETSPAILRHDVPNVQNAFLLSNVLTSKECMSLITMAEALGMVADQPIGGSAATMDSVSTSSSLHAIF
jgi:hypothetical protein